MEGAREEERDEKKTTEEEEKQDMQGVCLPTNVKYITLKMIPSECELAKAFVGFVSYIFFSLRLFFFNFLQQIFILLIKTSTEALSMKEGGRNTER